MVNNFVDIGNFVVRYAPRRCNWIGAAIGVASSLIGGLSSSGANRRAMERQENQERAHQAYYRRMANENYLDTAAGRELVRRARELSDRQTKQLRGAQAVGGGTDAAVALQKEAGNKQVSDLMGRVAIKDQDRKTTAAAQGLQSATRHAAVMSGYDQARANNISKVASGLSDAAMSLDGSLDKLAGIGSDSIGRSDLTRNNADGKSTRASVGLSRNYDEFNEQNPEIKF